MRAFVERESKRKSARSSAIVLHCQLVSFRKPGLCRVPFCTNLLMLYYSNELSCPRRTRSLDVAATSTRRCDGLVLAAGNLLLLMVYFCYSSTCCYVCLLLHHFFVLSISARLERDHATYSLANQYCSHDCSDSLVLVVTAGY